MNYRVAMSLGVVIAVVVALMVLGQCSIVPDPRSGWRWSDDEVAALTRRAEAGDLEAANSLVDYYMAHENDAKLAYWEDWLFKRGDPWTVELRAHKLYTLAHKRPDDDPRRLAELQEALRLWVAAYPDRVESPFPAKMRSEIAAIEGSK